MTKNSIIKSKPPKMRLLNMIKLTPANKRTNSKKLKNKKLDVKTESDQLLLDIFAKSSKVLNTDQNSKNVIPKFIPNPIL